MMDKSAIEKIQQSQAIRATQEAVDRMILQHPVVVSDKDLQLSSLERYLPNRVRFVGDFITSSIADFKSYVLKNHSSESQCFIDKDTHSAEVVFNLGNQATAGHADFKATLQLEKTSQYKTLLSKHDSFLSQQNLAEFMEDWADFITPLNSEGEPIQLSRAVGAVRRLVVEANAKSEHEVQDFRSSRSALENIEAKTDHGLPSEILFQCEPFNGLPEFNFYARISVISGEKPKLSFRIKRLEKVQDEIMESFKELVIENIGEKVSTYLGVFKG